MLSRRCLVCGGTTKGAHLGVDACRACAAFFRRAVAKQRVYTCRRGKGECDKQVGEPIVNCRKCRYMKCIRLGMRVKDGSEEDRSPSPMDISPHQPSTSINTTLQETRPQPTKLELLEKIKEQISIMNLVRKTSEVASRNCQNQHHDDPEKQIYIREEGISVFPATFTTTNEWARVSVSVAGHFATSTFPMFTQLSPEEKWVILKNFFNLYFFFDQMDRSWKLLPDPYRCRMVSYTSYYDLENIEYFFRDLPLEIQEKVPSARSIIKEYTKESNEILFPMLKRAELTEAETHALIALMVWTPHIEGASENIGFIGEHYRQQIFHELHVYYREHMCIENYAERMGNMTMILMCLQEHGRQAHEKFEVFRLLDIFNDDTYVYQMTR